MTFMNSTALAPIRRPPQTSSGRVLNPEQEEAASFEHGQLLVLAPAGTGKTEMMTVRVARIIGRGLAQPDEILALTFSNKAAREWRTRIGAALGPDLMPSFVGTFHKIGLDLLQQHPEIAKLKPGFMIATEEQLLDLVKASMQKAGHQVKKKGRFGADPVKQVANKFCRIKDDGFRPEDAASWLDQFAAANAKDAAGVAAARIAAEIAQPVQAALRRRNLADFSDMVLWPMLAMEADPDFRAAWASRWKFVVIDEYQDVNESQYRFARASASVHENLAAVGDDDQVLYQWRGSSQQYILRFTTDWPTAKIVKLCRNYRSVQPILDAASLLIAHNDNRFEKELIAAGATPAAGEVISATECRDPAHEAEVAVRAILTRDPSIELDECAVLYRSAYQGRAVEDALRKQGVGYGVVGGVSFYSRKEVLDALALLTMLEGTDEQEIEAAFRRHAGTASVSFADMRDGVPDRLPGMRSTTRDKLVQLVDGLGEANFVEGGPGAVLRVVLESTGYNRRLADMTTGRERLENVKELCALADRFADTFSFLEHCAAAAAEAETAGEYGRVQLLTIHAAKGLEFDLVIIIGCAEDHFPSARAIKEGRLDEERRAAYVGLTRARKRCILTWPRCGEGRRTASEPSRFIAEANIPAQLLDEPFKPAKKGRRRRFPRRASSRAPARKPWEPKDRYWMAR